MKTENLSTNICNLLIAFSFHLYARNFTSFIHKTFFINSEIHSVSSKSKCLNFTLPCHNFRIFQISSGL